MLGRQPRPGRDRVGGRGAEDPRGPGAVPGLQSVIVVGGRRRGGLEYERLLERASPELAPADTSRDDVALWLYTSGSTGRPKAAVHSHHDLVHAAELVGGGIFGIGPDDRVFSASKLHFAFGLGNSLYFPALVGAASILVPERLEAERVFELIQAERPTVLFAVATVYRRLLQVENAERRFDCSSLRLCVSSGETLPAALFHAWQARFGLELLDVVGSTEALHDFIANRPGRRAPASSGQVIPGFEARLVDDQGRPVAPGMIGHLLIKGDSTSPGYWNRHERTQGHHAGRLAAHRRHVLPGHRRLLLLLRAHRRHAEGGRHVGGARGGGGGA